MLIGVPAAGKTTWCKENPQIERISSDEIRKEWGILGTSEEDKSKNALVFEEVLKRAKKAAKENKDFAIDATNINSKRRIIFLKQFDCEKIGVVFATPIEECLKRNSKRERKVPEKVIGRMYRNFQPPAYEEGFNEINIITCGGSNTTIEDILDANEIPHDNHHHTLSCRKHCLVAEEIARTISKRENLSADDMILLTTAARYHDIGKFICKTFSDYKGNPTEEAHYFSHQNVSAYLFLCYDIDLRTKEKIFVANLIYHHMDFYMKDFKIEKMLFNNNFTKLLRLLNESDRAAH